MKVQDRITQAPACEVIELSEKEKDIYCGAGRMIARFEGGELVEFFNPLRLPYVPDTDIAQKANEAGGAAIEWIGEGKGEYWLVMCSGYELCEPRKINLKSTLDVAHLAQVIAELFLEEIEEA